MDENLSHDHDAISYDYFIKVIYQETFMRDLVQEYSDF